MLTKLTRSVRPDPGRLACGRCLRSLGPYPDRTSQNVHPLFTTLSIDQLIELSHSNWAKTKLWPAAIYCVQLLYSSNNSLRTDESSHLPIQHWNLVPTEPISLALTSGASFDQSEQTPYSITNGSGRPSLPKIR
ncbi:hypothetical protein F2Q68_00043890 [Brassica cretica]|uniref:Uncharacterized protein n=2 Tax=Brassica cretica TaxID=69181 RepID=A0A8S9LIJ1_BRACR|nr:hypothetical protein F2Q68_00043890 [Brassica cretica]KAF3518431.1 hypothetical protein DY000_02059771 [Brassica cretica]